MGKLAKLFMFLIFVVAFGFPRVAVDVHDRMKSQTETITELGDSLKDSEEKLVASEESRETLAIELDAEKSKRVRAEKDLASARRQASIAKAQLTRKEKELSTNLDKVEKLLQDVIKLEEEKSTLEAKVAKEAAETGTARRIPGAGESGEVPGAKEEFAQHGKVVAVLGSRLLTLNLRGGIGLDETTPSFFVHRGGRVLGKATVKRIHALTVVVETADRELLDRLKEGDLVQVEGDKLPIPELLEGKVVQISRHGFLSIDVNVKSQPVSQPVFLVYRNGKFVGRVRVKKVISLFAITELGTKTSRMRIAQGDYLRTPR
jgi:hypothetical protein